MARAAWAWPCGASALGRWAGSPARCCRRARGGGCTGHGDAAGRAPSLAAGWGVPKHGGLAPSSPFWGSWVQELGGAAIYRWEVALAAPAARGRGSVRDQPAPGVLGRGRWWPPSSRRVQLAGGCWQSPEEPGAARPLLRCQRRFPAQGKHGLRFICATRA